LLPLTSSISKIVIFAFVGPIFSIVSRAAAMIVVSALSSAEGIVISPLVFPPAAV